MKVQVQKLEKYIEIYKIFKILMAQENYKKNKIKKEDENGSRKLIKSCCRCM